MRVSNLGPPPGHHTRLLTPPDLPALQRLFERSVDYFQIATGGPPSPEEAARAFVAGPPSKSVDDKRVIGVFDADFNLVGVLDAITDWPEEGCWTMGMLLLEPGHRGKGLGTTVLNAYHDWARAAGARRFRTAVVAQHQTAVTFLETAGYHAESSLDGYDAGHQSSTVLFFERTV